VEVSISEEPAAGERRQLTVLFCDLVGSTERSARLDPEEWREIVARYQRSASEVVARFDGHVAQVLGDGLLAYFGWPRAHDDDAERAVRAGLALVEAAEGAPDGLSVRVGIHTGPVVVGALGAGERAETLAVGEVPNLAARVQALAEPGSVLVTAATHRLVAGLFVAEEVGERGLKGIPEPVALFRVVGTSGVRGRLRAAAARGLTPFVGRAEERRLLRSRWERALEGDGQVVLVAGEPGIGKSRLVELLREELSEVPHTWIDCACSPYHVNTPFFPVIDLLQQGLAWGADAKPGERVAGLERVLALMGLEPAQALPLLAPLLGLPVPEGYPPLLLAPEAQRKRLLATLVAWVCGGARLQPMVIVTEDVHWADPSTLELDGLLVEQGATVPLLQVFTARPEFRAPWPMRAHHAQLTLGRLPRREVREMVERVTLRAALAPEVIEGVVARTDGVPLFVEELTRLVLEEGGRGVGHEIPATLQDSLMARLDRLGPAKEVAQLASAIGREFSWPLLRAVAPLDDAELEAALARLADAELVYARGLPPDATYLFKHALVQDAAYASLLRSRRRELHRAIARALVERFPDEASAHPEVLAHHWTEAGEAVPAVEAWRSAAERSAARSALVEATAHYRRAIEVLGALPDSPEHAQQELLLQVALGQVLFAVKGYGSPEVAEAYDRARELGERIEDAAQLVPVLLGLWVSAFVHAELDAAQELADEMLRVAERDGTPVSLVWAHFAQGATRQVRCELHSARDHLSRAHSLLDQAPAGALDPGVPLLVFEGMVCNYLGFADAARAFVTEAVSRARRLGRAYELCFALGFGGIGHILVGDADRVAEHAEALGPLAAEHGFPMFQATAMVLRGWVLAQRGEPEEGAVLLREGLALNLATGARSNRASSLGWLAEAQLIAGTLAEAEATLDEALASVPENLSAQGDLLRLRADLLARQGGGQAAVEAAYREAMETARRLDLRFAELSAATSLGRLFLGCGRAAEARELVAPLYAWFTEGFDVPALVEARALLDDLDRAA
jgi:class 3 adenylate cyclase/predicted ATPase